MAIPERFIEELVARSDIAEVVGSYVALSRKGGNLFGLCPFHNEKTPSFSVSPERQIFHCFGCGVGGGVINFIMRVENLTYPDAIRFLAERAGMSVPEENESGEFRARRERLIALNRDAARYFHSMLNYDGKSMEERFASAAADGTAARQYVRSRGLSPGVVRRFGLGFAPDSWDGLTGAMTALGYEKRELLDAGLAVRSKNGGVYDKFRGRFMFPVLDVRGNVIGFSGRSMDGSEPKYLNSPETVLFDKRRHLFGMNIARKSKRGYIILCEGQMDAVSLHQAGIDCAVASLGTSLTEEQSRLISRYVGEVVLAYDGDEAGQKATKRAISILEKGGLKIKVLSIPGAKDPDEFIKKQGSAAFEMLLSRSENHIEYRLAMIKLGYDLDSDEQKVLYLKEAVELLSGLDSSLEREIYSRKVAGECAVSFEAVMNEVKTAIARGARRARRDQERRAMRPAVEAQPQSRAIRYDNVRSAVAEEWIVAILAADAGYCSKLAARLKAEEFSSPLLGRFYGRLTERSPGDHTSPFVLLGEDFTPDEVSHLVGVCDRKIDFGTADAAMEDYIAVIKRENKRAQSERDPLLDAFTIK